MRFLFHLLTFFAVALAVGFGLSYFALSDGRLFGAIRVGPWAAWPEVGVPNPDPYTRAHLARAGALQLGRSEGIQFVAEQDSAGAALDRSCAYRLEGPTPVATFWTLAAVDDMGSNIAAVGTPLALDSARVVRRADGIAIVNVSAQLAPQNWLEIGGTGPFALVLTFYDTQVFSVLGSSVTALPSIVRGTCR